MMALLTLFLGPIGAAIFYWRGYPDLGGILLWLWATWLALTGLGLFVVGILFPNNHRQPSAAARRAAIILTMLSSWGSSILTIAIILGAIASIFYGG